MKRYYSGERGRFDRFRRRTADGTAERDGRAPRKVAKDWAIINKLRSFPCGAGMLVLRSRAMITLAEIEAASDALSTADKSKLILYLAAQLHAQGGALPETFLRELGFDWMAEDEAVMRRFTANE